MLRRDYAFSVGPGEIVDALRAAESVGVTDVRHLRHPQSVVFVLSDGLDVGDPTLLRQNVREVHRRSAAVIWLNPSLHTAGYAPDAQGMRAALPYIDRFAPAATVADLVHLAHTIHLSAR